MTALRKTQSLSNFDTILIRVVFAVTSNQSRNTEASLVLLTHLRAWRLRSYHEDRQIFTNLHTLLNNVETVSI